MRLGLFNKEDDPNPQLSGYVKNLNQQIEDAAKMLTVVESCLLYTSDAADE